MKKFLVVVAYIVLSIFLVLCLFLLLTKLLDKEDITTSNSVIKEEEIKKESPKKLSLLMVGDALIHNAVYNDAKQADNSYDFKKMFAKVKPLTEGYDLKFYNQESILGGTEIGLSTYPRFNSPKEVGDAFLDMGFNLVSLANNHTLDRGEEGIISSLNYWKDKNVLTAGSYESLESRNNPIIKSKNGISYALLAYTTVTNGLTRPEGKEYYLNVYDETQVKKDIELLRDKVDLLLVSMHFGTEYSLKQNEEQEKIANYLASLGVDIVIGHHPHVIEPITYIDNTLVIYSLGNFISGQLTVDQLTGLMVGVDVIKEKDQPIKLVNLRADLTYTKTKNSTTNAFEYEVIPYNELTDDILKNKEEHKQKYIDVIQSLGVDIKIN